MPETHDELSVLRSEVLALREELQLLQAADASTTTSTRRGMLRLAGAAVLGAGALLADHTPVAADNGIVNTNQGVTTTLTHTATTGFHFKASDSAYATNSEVIQVSAGTQSRHCIRAFSNNITSTVFLKNDGIGSALLATSNSLGATATFVNNVGPTINLAVLVGKQDPRQRTGQTHFAGGLDVDSQSNLWYCWQTSVSGTPGKWQKLAGPTTAGAFHAITPIRVYDSRKAGYPVNGLRAPNTKLVIPVADSRDASTGAVITANVVPSGATAIAFNLTVTNTTGPNFASVMPGSAATAPVSTVNWTAAGQAVANASITAVDANRQVAVFIGGQTGSTHVIVDVQGYWL